MEIHGFLSNLIHKVAVQEELFKLCFAIIRILIPRKRKGEKPVSYTHLDVYKRQTLRCLLLKTSRTRKEIEHGKYDPYAVSGKCIG